MTNSRDAMIIEADAGHRGLCMRCRRAPSACWCSELSPRNTGASRLVLLQHPRESRNPIGTARMAHLNVDGSRLLVGVQFEEDASFRALCDDSTFDHVVLYPSPDAADVRELRGAEKPLCIWVIDGTWWQARKVWKRNPSLQRMPAYRISPSSPGQYRIRKEPAPHCLSTVEAVAFLVETLDGAPAEELLRPFHSMVEKQLGFVGKERNSRHARQPRPRSKRPAPVELVGNLANLVIVHGEGNGWPARMQDSPLVEMMQWNACRPSTGERFHMFVRPQTRAPGILDHLRLDESDVAGGEDPEMFARAWSAFSRPGDVLCTWGYFPLKLLEKAGFERPAYVNLQVVANVFATRKHGSIEQGFELLAGGGDVETSCKGRGGRRLAMLEAMVGALMRA